MFDSGLRGDGAVGERVRVDWERVWDRDMSRVVEWNRRESRCRVARNSV